MFYKIKALFVSLIIFGVMAFSSVAVAFAATTIGTSISTTGTLTLTTISNSMLAGFNSSGTLISTSTPTAAYYLATSSIASVFPYASTTAITATNASTSALIISGPLTVSNGLGSNGNCLTTNGSTLTTWGSCGSGGSTFSFTPTLNYGINTNATSTIMNFTAGIHASSTSQIAYASTTAITAANASTTNLNVSGSTVLQSLANGFLSVGSGLVYSSASSSLFGYTPLNPTRLINTTWPIQGGGDLSADRTLTFGGLSTSSAAIVGNLPYFSGVNTFANVATTSVTCAGGTTCSTFDVMGASSITITGLSWPFTASTNYNFNGQSTSTFLSFTNGLAASSTSYLSYASTTALTSSDSAYFATSGGSVGIGTTNPGSKLMVDGSAPANIQLLVQGAASQSADLMVVENSAGTDLFSIDASGKVTLKPSSNVGPMLIDGGYVSSNGLLDLKSYNRQNESTGKGILTIRGNATTLTGTLTGQVLDMTLVNTGTANTQQGLLVMMNNAGSGSSIGLDIQGGSSSNLVETGLKFTNASTAIAFADATSTIAMADAGSLYVTDGTNTFLALKDFGATGNLGIGTTTPNSTLHVGGSLSLKRTAVSANYTVLATDYYIGVTALPLTTTLPAAATAGEGRIYIIKDENGGAGANNITIDGNLAETIDGALTNVINTNYGSRSLISNGANWFTF